MDYFSKPSYRGSSPTANLAVDLSKNFHIDQRLAIHIELPVQHADLNSKVPYLPLLADLSSTYLAS